MNNPTPNPEQKPAEVSSENFSDVLDRLNLTNGLNCVIGFVQSDDEKGCLEFAGIQDSRIEKVVRDANNGCINTSPMGDKRFYKTPIKAFKFFGSAEQITTLQTQLKKAEAQRDEDKIEIKRLQGALRSFNKDPMSCTQDGTCVSHLAFLDMLQQRDKALAGLEVYADEKRWFCVSDDGGKRVFHGYSDGYEPAKKTIAEVKGMKDE